MSDEIRFFVPGIPQPGGSKKAFVIPGTNHASITEDNTKSKPWRTNVAWMASEHIKIPLAGALEVAFTFYMPRPKGHFRSGRNRDAVKPTAPVWSTTRPDVTKLVRSTEDALKGIAWIDDSQVASQVAMKIYGLAPGCEIAIRRLEAVREDVA